MCQYLQLEASPASPAPDVQDLKRATQAPCDLRVVSVVIFIDQLNERAHEAHTNMAPESTLFILSWKNNYFLRCWVKLMPSITTWPLSELHQE